MTRQRKHWLTATRVGLFLLLWLAAGYCLGTETLLGPVRWIAASFRSHGYPQQAERFAVIVLIVALTAISAALAAAWTGVVLRTSSRHVRFGLPALVLLAGLGSVWLWMQPNVVNVGAAEEQSADLRFTFGAYPDEAKLELLKSEGYTAVVSLLHPAVAPFEPVLIAREREAAARVGIRLIEVPMLPWVSGNAAALARIRELVKGGTGRYYVHCYLGMDRVELVRRTLGEEPKVAVSVEGPGRALKDRQELERGQVEELDDGVFLAPLPTPEEYVGYVIAGGIREVVSLLDPANSDDLVWLKQEREFTARYHVPLVELPLANDPVDPAAVHEAVERVKTLPRPLIVHAFLAPSTGKAPAASAFAEAYRASLPPLIVRLLRRAIPSRETVLTLWPVLLLAAGAFGGLAGRLRAVRGVPAPYTRKVFHFSIFTLAGVLQLAGGLPLVTLFGSLVSLAVLYAVWRGDGFPFYEAMARPTDAPHRTLFVLVPLATTVAGGVLANLIAPTWAYVAYLVGGWADALAEPVGTRWGRHRYRVPSLAGVPASRSIEGSVTVLLVGAAAAAVALALGGVAVPAALGVGIACGAAGAAVEAFSSHGLDNLTIQATVAAVVALLLR